MRSSDRQGTLSAETGPALWQLEFVTPAKLASRCNARKLPVNSPDTRAAHCAADDVITISNPCKTEAPGWYERTLCHEIGHANGWPADHSSPISETLPLARYSPAALALGKPTLSQ